MAVISGHYKISDKICTKMPKYAILKQKNTSGNSEKE